jgi:hypothetical protein
MANSTWRGDDDGIVPLNDPDTLAWLRRRLHAELFVPAADGWKVCKDIPNDGGEWSQEASELLIDWYMARPERYTRWLVADTFKGDGFSAGEWALKSDCVTKDFAAAAAHADEQLDADHDTLDDWLDALASGSLLSKGHPGGMAMVPAEFKRPKCRTCGKPFTPKRRKARNCDTCISAVREVRRAMRPK